MMSQTDENDAKGTEAMDLDLGQMQEMFDAAAAEGDGAPAAAPRASLEAKMANWDATEEEVKAATLGGMVPGSKGAFDGFDIGLYIAFPFMVATSLVFALFPVIMSKIDVSSVGPPPMV